MEGERKEKMFRNNIGLRREEIKSIVPKRNEEERRKKWMTSIYLDFKRGKKYYTKNIFHNATLLWIVV